VSATDAPQGSTNTIDKDEEIARLKGTSLLRHYIPHITDFFFLAENTQLRHASAASNDNEVKVPRPTLDSNKLQLLITMGLEDDKDRFNAIRVCLSTCFLASL
jgi:hypothetical protein